ncbi:DedA family protein [Campylobacter sputorum subsp. bubulus]|uniref:DedA family protein n=1 Tax=Campylobacter sputorum subsp. sputorum TaxID=32024 RepID=A0A381DGM1_9BACT|nr:DedA family protein [Campylobacter sputorum]ASM34928.1 putative membrane protein, DedA family, type I (SNARE domain) [Campylobacter sputorum aubsp. sputorum RM3237]KAB0581943.1 DedA family protein [Campylobacter sputorum subsp. sputorum]QEL05119.1 DedA family membrane protein, type I (SNARE domain) [Campylobacter sputorum subsp. sputorum]SUX09427.1 DedA family protein [Campylobacter sputorum subsp. sputorum]SUX30815.1 DedA family protein [Campylobacter sputorum subsp. bubulus]
MENYLKEIMLEYHQYAYLILFFWCILEGELALILGGILAHEGHVNLGLAIFIAGIGGFMGDQIYFYIGRYNKKYITKKLHSQRRKFAVAHLLLQKYGWPVIFLQRYMYGFRTIIPMSIGITRYNAKKFAFINLISAWIWAAFTITLAWYFGQQIWDMVTFIESKWYFAVPIILLIVVGFFYTMKKIEAKILNERKYRKNAISI